MAAAVPDPHSAAAAAAAAVPVPPPLIPPGDGGLSAIIHVAAAAAQGAGTAAQAVTSVMMLAMVASAVVSTVSMSAVMVQRAQQAATPSPAAALSALINTPNPPPRPTVARRDRTPPIQQVTETSISRSIVWAPPAPPAPPAAEGDGSVHTVPHPHELPMPPPKAPEEPGCNVSYTKTVTTTTMEPGGNVSHAQTYTWFVPCADAPALPPVGAPDPAVVTRTTSLIGRPQGMHTGDDGDAAGPSIDDSTILFGPGAHSADGAPAPAPDPATAGNTLASLLAALAPGASPADASSRLSALLAANPGLRSILPADALAALGPSSAGEGLDGSGPQYDVWGRAVTDPAREAAADAAENGAALLLARNAPAQSEAEREEAVARARAEQRSWWDAELERARREAHGGPKPVDFSHKAGAPAASEAHPVQHHVAMDMATEGLQGPDGGHWDVKGEVLDYVERMEWKHDLSATSARRFLRDLGVGIGRPWSASRARRRPRWPQLRDARLLEAAGSALRRLSGVVHRLCAAILQLWDGAEQGHRRLHPWRHPVGLHQ